jgi:hypothetical membrane protein
MAPQERPQPTALPAIPALFLVAAAIQYVVLEAVTAAAWHHPAYNYAVNFISDLGNPVPDDVFAGHLVNSPLHVVMDIAFVTQGVLFIAAALLLRGRIPGRLRTTLLALAVLHGTGIILVGFFHEYSAAPLSAVLCHSLGAAAAILAANTAAIMVGAAGARLSAATWYRTLSIALGIIGLAGFVLLEADRPLYYAAGGIPERIAVYTIVVWQAVTGITILVSRARAGSDAVKAAQAA